MFETLVDRAGRAGRERARVVSARLAERIGAEVPSGMSVEATSEGVLLSGRGVARRFALDPALRWLVTRVR
jgi:hypothetical protein